MTCLPRYPKPCRYPRPCPATRSLVPLPETSLALYPKPCPKPCPATRSLARNLGALPEALPRYPKPRPKPCPATRSLAPLPEALSRYPSQCCCWRWCCCWCCCARALPANQVRLRHSLLAKKHQTGLRHASTPEEVFSIGVLVKNPDFQ